MADTGDREGRKRAYTELAKQKAITTMKGNTTIVHPVEAVTLGQAVVVVANAQVSHNT